MAATFSVRSVTYEEAFRIGARTALYQKWADMKYRCTNSNHPDWHCYGGRGVTFEPRWRIFANFVVDMGVPEPGLELDRADPNGHYTKSNCQWVTRAENARNRRPVGDTTPAYPVSWLSPGR